MSTCCPRAAIHIWGFLHDKQECFWMGYGCFGLCYERSGYFGPVCVLSIAFYPIDVRGVLPSLWRAQEKDGGTPSQPAHFGRYSPKEGQPVLGSYYCPREKGKRIFPPSLCNRRLFPHIQAAKTHLADARNEFVWGRACEVSHPRAWQERGIRRSPGKCSSALQSSPQPWAAELWKSLWRKSLSSFFCLK